MSIDLDEIRERAELRAQVDHMNKAWEQWLNDRWPDIARTIRENGHRLNSLEQTQAQMRMLLKIAGLGGSLAAFLSLASLLLQGMARL